MTAADNNTESDPYLLNAIILVAAAAPLLALTTSFYKLDSFSVQFMRFFSTPVSLIELCAIILGLSRGAGFSVAFVSLSRAVKASLALLLVIAGGTAFAATADPASAIIRTCAWVIHLLFGLTVYQLVFQFGWRGLQRQANLYILYGLMIWMAGLLVFFLLIKDIPDFPWTQFLYGVGNVRQLGFYGCVGFCLAAGLIATSNNRSEIAIVFAIATFSVTLVYWASVRSALFGMMAAISIGLLSFPALRSKQAIFALFGPLFAAIPIAIILGAPDRIMGFWRLFGQAPSLGMNRFTSGRWEVWQATVQMVLERPFFGYGESQFRKLVPENRGELHPHNIFLQISFSWGLIGTVIFFYFLFRIWLICFAGAKRKPDAALPAYLCLAGLFVFAQLEGAMYHTWPTMIFTYLCAMSLGACQRA